MTPKTKKIVIISVSTLAAIAIGYLLLKKKTPKKVAGVTNKSSVAGDEPKFSVLSTVVTDAGGGAFITYNFGDITDGYFVFGESQTVKPYTSKQSPYTLRIWTDDLDYSDASYGQVSFDLMKDGKFVRTLSTYQ